MSKHIGAYSSLHGPAGKTLTDYAEQNIPALWNTTPERITSVANNGSQYTGVIPGYTAANPFVYSEDKFFFFTPHVNSLAAPWLSLNGLPLHAFRLAGDRNTPLQANYLMPDNDYLLRYKDNIFEILANLTTLGVDLRSADRVIQLLAHDGSIASYSGGADVIATGGYATAFDAGGKFWKRTTTTVPTLPTFWRREAADNYWYSAITKRTVFGEEIGITGDTNDPSDNYAPQINEVFTWMNTRGGGRLILPPGQIRCNSNINILADGVMLEGTAAGLTSTGGTTLLMSNNASIIIGGNIATGGTRNHQIHIKNLGLQQEDGSTVFLFNSQAVTGLHFTDIHCGDLYGFHTSGNTSPLAGATPNSTLGATYNRITGTLSSTESTHFARFTNAGNFTMQSVGINGASSIMPGSSAIYFPTGASAVPDACSITSCRFTGFDKTLRIDNGISNLNVANCVFNRCGTNAIDLNPDTTILGAYFSDSTFAAVSPPTMAQIGMRIADTTGSISRLSVQSCQFLNWGRSALWASDPSSNLHIMGCQFEDNCAGDSTEASSVIVLGTLVNDATVTNNQIYKRINSGVYAPKPRHGINIASTQPRLMITNNQIEPNDLTPAVGTIVTPVNNPNRGTAHLRRVHNNTYQVFEGQVVILGPWGLNNASTPAPGNPLVATGTGLMELADITGIGTALIQRRGRVIAVACRASQAITSGAESIKFNVLIDGSVSAVEAVSDAPGSLEIFDEDINGSPFDLGSTLGVRWTTSGYSTATIGGIKWVVFVSVYFD